MHPVNPKAGEGGNGWGAGRCCQGQKLLCFFPDYLKIVSQDFNRCSVVKYIKEMLVKKIPIF